MSKIRVAFFKASHGQLDDKIIDLGSGRLGYSHCEMLVGDNVTIGAHYTDGKVVESYYPNILTSLAWTVLELNAPKAIEQRMKAQLGVEYDTAGVACKFVGLRACIDPSKTWCSKAVAHALRMDDIDIMPNYLFEWMIHQGATEAIAPVSSKWTDGIIALMRPTKRLGRIAKKDWEIMYKDDTDD